MLTGGGGVDIFRFDVAPSTANADVITDFTSGSDRIALDPAAFASLGALGNFVAGDARFAAGAGFSSGRDASDRVVYDTSTGKLYYDADGSGAGAAQLIATLSNRPALAATDIAAGEPVLPGTVYQFSAVADGRSIQFDAARDVLRFDQTDIAAADVRLDAYGPDIFVSVTTGPHAANVVWLRNVSPTEISSSNVTFADGSLVLYGNDAANSLIGGAGSDLLMGFGGSDTLNGGPGDDVYYIDSTDVLVDSGGIDEINIAGSWTLGPGFERLNVTGSAGASIVGNDLDNTIVGGAGNDTIDAGGGNDVLLGGDGDNLFNMSTGGSSSPGNDTIFGGDGIDTVNYDGFARSAVTVTVDHGSLRASGGGDGGTGTATLIYIERIIGGAFGDRLTGGLHAEQLDGRGGNDTLSGGRGNDTLAGGAGLDQFVFAAAPGAANADVLSDFVSGQDRLVLDGLFHLGAGSAGDLAAGDARFASGPGVYVGPRCLRPHRLRHLDRQAVLRRRRQRPGRGPAGRDARGKSGHHGERHLDRQRQRGHGGQRRPARRRGQRDDRRPRRRRHHRRRPGRRRPARRCGLRRLQCHHAGR